MNVEITFRGLAPQEFLCVLVRQRLAEVALSEPFGVCRVLLESIADEPTRPLLRAHVELRGSPHGTRILVQARDTRPEAAIDEAFARITRKADTVWTTASSSQRPGPMRQRLAPRALREHPHARSRPRPGCRGTQTVC
jgi:hypothetical protein